MAPDDGTRNSRPTPFQLDYKTVLGGACTLIVILAGFAWGTWTTSHESEILDNQRINTAQWERIRALNDTLIKLDAEHDSHRKDIDDQEVRIRALEHRGDRP